MSEVHAHRRGVRSGSGMRERDFGGGGGLMGGWVACLISFRSYSINQLVG